MSDAKRIKQQLGIRLAVLRVERSLTQEDMGDVVDYKYYQRLEEGKANVTLETLIAIKKKLKCDLADFFDFKNLPKKKPRMKRA